MNDFKAPIRKWVSGRLTPEINLAIERLARTRDVHHVAVMPDVHFAGDVCVGTVLATQTILYPAAVGADIGCGILSIGLDETARRFAQSRDAARLLSTLYESVPQNRHRQPISTEAFDSAWAVEPLSHPRLDKQMSRDGRIQLGTLGRGNHFLEFQADQDDRLWLMIHSGSRAMGQAITNHHLANARRNGATGRLIGLDIHDEAGIAYLHDMNWARRYADANRRAMMNATIEALGRRFGIQADRDSIVHTDHNHVRQEVHFGEHYWVHRKGAQQLDEHAFGLVPGSMGTASYIVAGRGESTSLTSCSHGAGRQLSRGEARRKISVKALQDAMGGVWFDHRHPHSLREEAPAAYKNIRQVMRDQQDLVRIVAEHRPVLSFKGK